LVEPPWAVFFFLEAGPFFAVDFFFAVFDVVELVDFFDLGDADSFGFGVDSSISESFFLAGIAAGESSGSSVSVGFGFAFAFGVGDGLDLLFDFFAFGVGDLSASVLRNCCLRASSSVACARRNVPSIALNAPRQRSVTDAVSCSSGLRGRIRGRCRSAFPLASQNRVQLASKQEKKTGEVHPGEQNNDRGESKIGRIITVVSRHVVLE
jgi:hypothetical protein